MVKIKKTEIEMFDYDVEVNKQDIAGGECRNPNKCMQKVANARALFELLGANEVDRLRLDGAQIKFNYNGHRWSATTPKKAKRALIAFDAGKPVAPHEYTVTAIKGTKIKKTSAERMHQINVARQSRRAIGLPDRKPDHDFRKRVIGLGGTV